MALDLTDVKANINNIKRNLFFEEGVTLKIYKINTLLLEITENWYMSKKTKAKIANEPSDPVGGGEEYYVCSISDTSDDGTDFAGIIPAATHVVIGNNKYGIDQYQRPRGVTNDWRLRLSSVKKL